MLKQHRTLALGLLSSMVLAACSTLNVPVGNSPVNPGIGAQSLQNRNAQQYQVVQLQWQNPTQISNIAGAGLDLFGANPRNKTAKARVTPQDLEVLKANGVNFQPVIEAQMNTQGSLPGGYMTYEQMVQKIKALAEQYPHLVTIEDVGDTYLKKTGRAPTHDIWAIYITNKKKLGKKPSLMLTAGVHARELAPVELVMKLAEELTSQYGKDPEITDLVDNREAVLLPMVNVDGRIEVQNGDTWKRKNMNASNGDGVDLNRNFDAHWNYEGLNVPSSWKRGLTNPWGQTYSGPSKASEPETQAVQDMYRRKDLDMSMDIHAYGEMFFWPLGSQREPIPEVNVYKNIYANTFKNIGYAGGTSLELLYATSGTTDDYGYLRHKAFSMGLEVGKSFRPDYREVEMIYQQTRKSFLGLLRASATAQQARANALGRR